MAKLIPQSVKDELSWYLQNEKGSIVYLGKKEGKEYYQFSFDEEGEYGFPIIVEYVNKKAMRVPEIDAVFILQSLLKD